MKFQKPVIVYNYPKDIKAFYMKVNDDCKTVAAMDVLVPKVHCLILPVCCLVSMHLILVLIFAASLHVNKLIYVLNSRWVS